MECDESFSDDSMLQKSVDYLMGRDEERRTRSKNYVDKVARDTRRFVRFYRVKNKELSKSKMLNNTDKAFIFDLMPFISRESNVITSDRGIPMTAKEICKELEISKATFYVVSKKLIDCGVLVQEPYENKIFFRFNEDYFKY